MKLEKPDREKLYKAKGRAVKISWPLEDAPRKGERRAVYGDSGEKVFSIRVEAVRWREGAALVVLDDDPIRILPGLVDEPEKVSEAYEDLLCFEAAARNALLQGEAMRRRKIASKEASTASSTRSQKAKERHIKRLEAA